MTPSRAARVCEEEYQRMKDTEAAHYRQSAEPFDMRDFGFNPATVEQSRNLAAAIRALGAGWISVKDALPEHEVYVIVYAFDEYPEMFTAHYDAKYKKWYRPVAIDDYWGDGDIPITHWQPLPQPPAAR